MDSFNNMVDQILGRKWVFLLYFFIIFTLSYALLAALDFLPEPKQEEPALENSDSLAREPEVKAKVAETPAKATSTSSVTEQPVKVSIPALKRDISVVLAASSAVTDLDKALLSGVVRHPDSAALGQEGNVVILGHSSYLPNVFNKNFQALNGVQNLAWGDLITVTSDTTEYTYHVKKVYKAKASEAVLPTSGVGKRLTLVTCNSFATADDRFIVEADLVQVTALKSGAKNS